MILVSSIPEKPHNNNNNNNIIIIIIRTEEPTVYNLLKRSSVTRPKPAMSCEPKIF